MNVYYILQYVTNASSHEILQNTYPVLYDAFASFCLSYADISPSVDRHVISKSDINEIVSLENQFQFDS